MTTRDEQQPPAAGRDSRGTVFNLAGTILGKYRLIEKVGQGGMAQVYQAYQPDLDRYVAVKVLHPHLIGDEDFAARFRREARVVASLEHPHIVRVYDFNADGELAFLVMERLEGQSLKTFLRELDRQDQTMPLKEICRIVGALADALDYAHGQGLVHRDVKPSNIIITTNGRPVLTDFGIARILEGATAITESGGTLGTPAYMSPEQCKGEPGDARSDIYALGILLYQLCTGRIPFDADTPYAVILKHISSPLPSPRSLRPDLPEAVERVILKALAKEPDDRYQTAGELGAALHRAIHQTTDDIDHTPTPGTKNARKPATLASGYPTRIIIAAVVTFFVCVLLFLLTRPWRIQRYLDRMTPSPEPTNQLNTTLEPAASAGMLVVEGPEVTEDTWLNPDLPDEVWCEADLVHLQGPLTPDRILLRFDLSKLPADAQVISATLSLKVELWGDESFPGAAVAFRILTPWEVDSASFDNPWSSPGLAAGVDYDSVPLDLVPVPDKGLLLINLNDALDAWHARGEPNYGVVLMMSADSHNWAHHWVYLSEQAAPADWPTLRVAFEETP